jgi:hypothetical protein
MNLDDMLKEASIVDHSWLEDGLVKPGEPTFQPDVEGVKNPNNVKPELEVEWGGAGPNIDIDEPAGEVERNLPPDAVKDSQQPIIFARDLMNQGHSGHDIIRELKAKFDQNTLKAASEGLREIFALEGIVGCIAVDARGYENCREAVKAAENSPYKRFIKYVIGCDCGDAHMLPAEGDYSLVAVESTGNGFDDFLASDEKPESTLVAHCRSTMLPILSARGDLAPSEMDQTMIDLMNVTELPGDTAEKLKEGGGKNIDKVKKAFRLAREYRRRKEENKYADSVDASEFMMDRGDGVIDVDEPVNREALEVDGRTQGVDLTADAGIGMDLTGMLEVDEQPFREAEFVGGDEIELNETKKPLGPLDVSMAQDMTI